MIKILNSLKKKHYIANDHTEHISKSQLGAPTHARQCYSNKGCKVYLKKSRAIQGERKSRERIKAPIFLEAVLAM